MSSMLTLILSCGLFSDHWTVLYTGMSILSLSQQLKATRGREGIIVDFGFMFIFEIITDPLFLIIYQVVDALQK